jgi:hypothetical protein
MGCGCQFRNDFPGIRSRQPGFSIKRFPCNKPRPATRNRPRADSGKHPSKTGQINRPQRKNISLILDGCILVENKTADAIHPIHRAQLLTYFKLSEHFIGFFLNWKVTHIKHGIRRMIRQK